MRRHLTRVAVLGGLLLSLGSCSLSIEPTSSPDPEAPTFPTLAPEVTAEFCIRGELWPQGSGVATDRGPPNSVAGVIDETDCSNPILPGSGYFEVWRVRVTTRGLVRFEVSSDFDSYLELVRINDVSDYANTIEYVGYNDDHNGLQPRLTCRLVPGVEYALAVSGLWDGATGPYILAARDPGAENCPK